MLSCETAELVSCPAKPWGQKGFFTSLTSRQAFAGKPTHTCRFPESLRSQLSQKDKGECTHAAEDNYCVAVRGVTGKNQRK